MRSVLAWIALGCLACGSATPAPSTPPTAKAQNATGSARPLTGDECQALAEHILDACHNRGNDRSSQDEGWCSDIERRTLPDDRSWIKGCTGHVTVIDEACFRSTTVVRSLMDCDSTVAY
jgi:hypothetical protein